MSTPVEHLYELYDLKIVIRDIEPLVWRRVRVPASIRLDKLHRAVQAAFHWTDGHLHEFEFEDAVYGDPTWDEEERVTDERSVDLGTALGAGNPKEKRFLYRYDFGDNWEHDILVEEIDFVSKPLRRVRCTAGQRQRPPEDCGGTSGYEELLATLGNPGRQDHRAMLEWVGGQFDPEFFDLAGTKRRLTRVPI